MRYALKLAGWLLHFIIGRGLMSRHLGIVQATFMFVGVVVASTTARAVPITYTESATITGSLDGAAFSDSVITISGSGDTANVINDSGVFRNLLSNVSFSIAGVGSGTFTDSIDVFDTPSLNAAGIADSTLVVSILDTFDSVFGAYQLTTAIGPITNSPFINPTITFPTTAGGLQMFR
jgi:hypothetical protein